MNKVKRKGSVHNGDDLCFYTHSKNYLRDFLGIAILTPWSMVTDFASDFQI